MLDCSNDPSKIIPKYLLKIPQKFDYVDEIYSPSILKKISDCKLHILVCDVILSPIWIPLKPTKPPSGWFGWRWFNKLVSVSTETNEKPVELVENQF
jgi:hypothetical protein